MVNGSKGVIELDPYNRRIPFTRTYTYQKGAGVQWNIQSKKFQHF